MAADPTPTDPALRAAEAHTRAEGALFDALTALAEHATRLRGDLHYRQHLPTDTELLNLATDLSIVAASAAAMRVLRDVGGWAR